MNLCTLFKQTLRGPAPEDRLTDSIPTPKEEPLPWGPLHASDVLVTVFTVVALLLLHAGVMTLASPSWRWLAPLAPAGLLLVFSDAFVGRRKNTLAASLYPGLFGAFLVTAALPLLGPAKAALLWWPLPLGLLWALAGLLFWQRYQAPSAVSQVVTGVFVATVIPAAVVVFGLGEESPVLASGLLYTVALGFSATCSWLGLKFDRMDVTRVGVHSRIAFWFHSKGAVGLAWGMFLPNVAGSRRLLPFSLQHSSGLETAMGALCLFAGLTAVFVSLRWNRKYYLWAGALLLTLGLMRLIPGNLLWVAFGVLLGLIAVLYEWDSLLNKVRPATLR